MIQNVLRKVGERSFTSIPALCFYLGFSSALSNELLLSQTREYFIRLICFNNCMFPAREMI